MKKLIIFFIIILLYFFYIDFYLPEKINSSIKSQFYLYLRENVDFKNFEIDDYFFPVYKVYDISGNNFYIKSLKINYFTKKVEIVNGFFSNEIKDTLIDLLKNANLLNLSIKNINLINCSIIYDNYIIKNFSGKFNLNEEKKEIKFFGFINNQPFKIVGEIFNNLKIDLELNFKQINFKNFFKNFFKIQLFPVTFNESMDINLNILGRINKVEKIKFEGFNSNFNISMDIFRKKDEYFFNNGIIQFLNDEDNSMSFYGKVSKGDIWSLIFNAKNEYLKIPIKNSIVEFNNIDFEYSLSWTENNEIDLLKLYSTDLKCKRIIYDIFSYFWHKNNFSYSIFIDNVNIDNITVKNLDLQLTATNGEKSINKFNFNIDGGKVLFSLINDESKFKLALNTKKASLKKVFKFLYNDNINVDGIFYLSFLGFGKNKTFQTGKGIIKGRNLFLSGISFQELDQVIKNQDIKNIYLSQNIQDNSSNQLNFYYMRGNIGIENNKIIFKKLFLKSKKFNFKLDGVLDYKENKNIIFTGKYFSNNYSSDVIINVNLKEKILQFIGK